MNSDNYFASQTIESLITPQQFTNPLELPAISGRNLISPHTIAFVDSNIDDAMTVMANLKSDVKILLDPTQDGISQITEALKNYQGLSGIDIISHGSVANLQLGNNSLNANSLSQYTNALQQWKTALTSEADILIYGCNVAAGESGQTFINKIGNLTGADVAASIDTTGNAAKGGNWTLEYATGKIETATPFTDFLMNSYQGILPSLFTTQTPVRTNLTDGTGSNGDYELGMEFQSAKSGQINAIRYYKAASEIGTHIGKIWSSTGQELASVTFANETAAGWQQQTLATPLTIAANTNYVVSVNANQYYVTTNNGIATTITNGDISAIADGSNGVYNETPSTFPTQSYQNSNYFRDIVFTPVNAPAANGTISLSGTPTQTQILTATISDSDGLSGVTPAYQWQQSTNGTTWTNITGATSQAFTLTQAQVSNQVRATASYTDPLGSSENPISPATAAVVNVNDLGIVAITGTPAVGQILSANVTDVDGLTGVTPAYQWQQSSNGTNWTAIGGATSATLTLAQAQVGNQVRVNALYTDTLGGNENILSSATGAITTAAATESLFAATATPTQINLTDGTGSNGDYELGMEFQSAQSGQINAIRYYKAASETGTHVGRIWSSTGQELANVTFANETASGWQQQTLATPLTIAANTKYVVSVNANQYYVATNNGIATTLTNGDISAVADGSNGVYNETPTAFPTQSYQNSNYFRDIVFSPVVAPAPNGTISLTGNPTQNQTLTATISDPNGLNGVTPTYQWQQSANGTTWAAISGATNATFILAQAQVNQQVRVTATYTDPLGTNETPISIATSAVVNVNDVGVVAIAGTTAVGQILTANVSDLDGLTGVTPTYQWQQSTNGTTWNNIVGATNATFALAQAQVGNQVRINALYTDALGGSENIFSLATSAITTVAATESLFAATATPAQTNLTDGTGSNGDYELGMEFQSAKSGQINAIRYYKAASETGTHVGRIWSSTGTLLGSVTFANETGSGWQQQTLATPVNIAANTKYVVSVNANQYYVATNNGIATTLTNGDISAVADGSNGVYNETPSAFPTQSYQNSNYFRDIVFTPVNAPAANGSITFTGTPTQNQTLTAAVTDTSGLAGVTINYQWQQSANSTTWTNITGATNQTLTLTQAQVGNQVRATATYTDALGSSEAPISNATTAVVNVNDPGTVTIAGTTAVGQTLSANVTDLDGLTGVTPTYQWQQSTNGTTWTNISGATNSTLTLAQAQVGNQVRVNAIYTDALGGNENILSPATSAITTVAATESLFAATATPTQTNLTDGTGSNGDYELGMEFQSAKSGQINAIRYYKSASETGTHIGRIWSSTGQELASVTFTNETASGWQQQTLTTPLTIAANTKYVVSVNANQYYVATNNGIATTLTNGDLSAVADGSNGVYNVTPTAFPTQSFNNSNYFRDIVFTASNSAPPNGTITINGTATQNQTLSATVADTDGLAGVTISYQWQQSTNGNTWTNITSATNSTLNLTQALVGKQVRVNATYFDALGNSENATSTPTIAVANVNEVGTIVLKGSATTGHDLDETVFDTDGLTGVTINYQWQQFVNNTWSNVVGATSKSLTLTTTLLGQQVRVLASYIDALGSSENVVSAGVTVTAQNAIVLENQKTGTTAWEIDDTSQATNEIAGFADTTSINKGESINLKVSLAQTGQYSLDVYRLGYYGGTGGRLVTSVTGLNGVVQSGPTTNATTKLVEYNWNTSYTLQTDSTWTTGLYFAKLTDTATGKQNYIQFVLRDDNRPADIGFQDAIATAEAYNNYGGYSVYDFNSNSGQRAYQVSFDRPFQYKTAAASEQYNNTLTWEYNMTRWMESQGYDISYYTNLDVSTKPLQLYSQKTYLSVGHDEYWSKDQRDNVEQARDNGTNLAFFSANTAYWQVRYDSSTSGQANRVMTVYKDTSYPAIGRGTSIDPIAQTNPTAATTLFRSSEVNRPENALLGVGYIGDWGSNNVYNGADYVVSNAADPYYANTGLNNGDKLTGLVGYEWDGLLNNGLTPTGLVVLSQSPVQPQGQLPLLPSGTNTTRSNAVRYTASSGAKVFSTGSIQWVWGLDSYGVTNPRVDARAQQIAVNVFADMGTKPQTPASGIVV